MNTPMPPAIAGFADLELLGEGGFAFVFSALDLQLGRRVAVKVLKRVPDADGRRRFDRECRAMARASGHKNILDIYHAGYTQEGLPYLVTELVDGGSLGKFIPGGMPVEEATSIIIDISDGLAQAHQRGVIHRDIKPDNILVGERGPLLADFGIAHVVDETLSAQVAASWYYSPPETFGNRRDERSDVYSLAATLYALVTGVPPFVDGDWLTFEALMARILTEDPPEIPEGLTTPGLNQILQRAMAKDPDARYQSALEFGTAISDLKQRNSRADRAEESPISAGSNIRIEPPHRLFLIAYWATFSILVFWFVVESNPLNLSPDESFGFWIFMLVWVVLFSAIGSVYFWIISMSAMRDARSSVPTMLCMGLLIYFATNAIASPIRSLVIAYFSSTVLVSLLNYYRFGFDFGDQVADEPSCSA